MDRVFIFDHFSNVVFFTWLYFVTSHKNKMNVTSCVKIFVSSLSKASVFFNAFVKERTSFASWALFFSNISEIFSLHFQNWNNLWKTEKYNNSCNKKNWKIQRITVLKSRILQSQILSIANWQEKFLRSNCHRVRKRVELTTCIVSLCVRV